MKYRNLLILCALCLLNGFSEATFGQESKESEKTSGDKDSGGDRGSRDDFGRGRGGYGRYGRGEGRNRDGGNGDSRGGDSRGGDSRGGDSRGYGGYQRGEGGSRGSYQRGGESDGRSGDQRSSDSRSGDTRNGESRSYQSQTGADGKSTVRRGAARVGTQKTSASLTLPGQYVAKDTNRDGQIAVYEWSQSDLSTFRKLDLNGDGFIIPSEFANPGRASAGTTVASAIPPGGTGGSEKSSAPVGDQQLAEVEKNFGLWDTNKNGQLEQDEFENTIRAQRVFEKAKLKFVGPMLKDKFVETYMTAVKTKSS